MLDIREVPRLFRCSAAEFAGANFWFMEFGMIKVVSALVLATIAIAPAHAVTVTLSPAGTTAVPSGINYDIIQSYTTNAAPATPFVPSPALGYGSYSNAGVASESTTGAPGNITYRNAPLNGMTGNEVGSDYIRITGLGTSYSISFSNPVAFFSFAFNNINNFRNQLTLTYAGDSGAGVFNSTNNFGVTDGTVPAFGRLSYDTGSGPRIISATFSRIAGGTPNPFHIDDIAVAVPEPAAWLMMILGFGVVGSQLRRRKGKLKLTFARA